MTQASELPKTNPRVRPVNQAPDWARLTRLLVGWVPEVHQPAVASAEGRALGMP